VTGIKSNTNLKTPDDQSVGMVFPNPPSASFLTCRPLVESATAEITVNPENGVIQSFNITDTPKERQNAFSDNFLPHNKTHASSETGYMTYNVTVR
jgi:hypothetical protein